MDIRPCREEDLELLEAHMPSPGRTRRHAARFEKQQRGLSTFLVAWSDGTPVGTAQILWRGCEAPEVRERFPGCPELNGLGVWPPRLRSRGIGTAVIRAAETRARRAGHHRIGLGVDDRNLRAASLYLRLGYEETGCRYLDRYHYLDDNGSRHEVADPCRFLTKRLTGQPG
ncbi:GNAT family N-acetyltransferase [Streptomyces sp. NP-1717]|uniref:GNAT family N-acetyltransferase n=1 Tax=unclassified Streptomyces TaxID=2593676 RepID=UPI001F5E1EB3|nr:GNAT family N-acetyltransferase [Streptomyces sp. NP-1717]MCI3221328.1 GNAT family N-acetyltransferase [Streptomyces sp. NP-1717]WTA71592.1 GNAT family N-acetyltransferase [Streptomyces sp. NBC_00838]